MGGGTLRKRGRGFGTPQDKTVYLPIAAIRSIETSCISIISRYPRPKTLSQLSQSGLSLLQRGGSPPRHYRLSGS